MAVQVAKFCPDLITIFKSFCCGPSINESLAKKFTVFRNKNNHFSSLFPKGRTAVFFLLKHLKAVHGISKIHLPAYTAQSLIYASEEAGFKIVLHDIDSTNLFFSKSSVDKIKTDSEKNLVILPYLWGMTGIRNETLFELQDSKSVIVEDFATCCPEVSLPLPNNHFGFIFSFGKTKLLSIGEGGLLFCKEKIEPEIPTKFSPSMFVSLILYWIFSQKIFFKIIANVGIVPKEAYPLDKTIAQYKLSPYWNRLLANFVVSDRFDVLLGKRQNIFQKLQQLPTTTSRHLPEIPGSRYPMVFPTKEIRDSKYKALNELNIQASRGYIDPIFKVSSLCNLQFPKNESAESLADRLLTLPLHDGMEDDFFQIEKIIGDQ